MQVINFNDAHVHRHRVTTVLQSVEGKIPERKK